MFAGCELIPARRPSIFLLHLKSARKQDVVFQVNMAMQIRLEILQPGE